jgi:hypothetical protein
VDLANLGSESETCVGSRVRLVGVSISFEKNFYRLPFTPPLWFAVSVLHHEGGNPADGVQGDVHEGGNPAIQVQPSQDLGGGNKIVHDFDLNNQPEIIEEFEEGKSH